MNGKGKRKGREGDRRWGRRKRGRRRRERSGGGAGRVGWSGGQSGRATNSNLITGPMLNLTDTRAQNGVPV